MNRSSTFWFGWPKEEISASERARQSAKRDQRLDQHMLKARNGSSASLGSGATLARAAVRVEARDAHDFRRGVDVQELTDSAFGRLFSTGEFAEEVDD
jgi:hypothetical protein